MNESDKRLLIAFIESLESIFSAAGCNDCTLPATEANIDLVRAAYDGEAPTIRNGKVLCDDFMVLAELRRRLQSS